MAVLSHVVVVAVFLLLVWAALLVWSTKA